MDIAIGRQRNHEVAMRESEAAGIALRRVRQRNQNVPRRSDAQKDSKTRQRMKLANPRYGRTPTAREKEINHNNGNRKERANQALGQYAQSAAGREGVAEKAEIARLSGKNTGILLFAQDDNFAICGRGLLPDEFIFW